MGTTKHQALAFGNGAVFSSGHGGAERTFQALVKDQLTGQSLNVELIPAPNETPFVGNPAALRYRLPITGRAATKVPEATPTEIFDRLRRWTVARARRNP